MNLWHYFPESLLSIQGIFELPIPTLCLFLYLLYFAFKHSVERRQLLFFLQLTVLASIILLLNLKPPMGKVIPPLTLLSVMLMPFFMLILKLWQREYHAICIWLIALLAGVAYAASASVWIFVIALS